MEFSGTERFEVRRKLGEGGMGIVYEAFDRKRCMLVAIKILRHLTGDNLQRFKREFRSLENLSHDKIIQFYELIREGDLWLLVMELVHGEDFIDYVRDGRTPPVPDPPDEPSPSTEETLTMRDSFIPPRLDLGNMHGDSRILPRPPESPSPIEEIVDIKRLRASLGQLAEALNTLHMASMVHRDLKPANVRVTPDGRVVLMDFGIVRQLTLEDTGRTAGTPAYMAPEQARPGLSHPAADWYAFGVMMYLALTGRLPLEGDPRDLMLFKSDVDPYPPSRFTDGIPRDLEKLCVGLLSREPDMRPSGNEVLEQLQVPSCDMASSGEFRILLDSEGELFVGRQRELDVLHRVYAQARTGDTCCVFIEGPSGIGRSSLVRRFLSELGSRDDHRPLVLSGHSWARESLTYKAFDGIVDDLAKYLSSLTESVRRELLSDDSRAIAWLFPSLERFFPPAEIGTDLLQDPYEQRAHAIVALRTLLCKIAQTKTVVLYTDDVQWADRDSVELLLALMRRPVIPRVMMLATLRTGEHESADSDAAQHLQRVLDSLENEVECRHLQLGPLSESEQREFIVRMAQLPEFQGMKMHMDAPLWREAAGNPMLMAELARSTSDTPHDLAMRGQLHLEDVVSSRFGRLSDDARGLMECIVLAGEPLPLRVLARASRLTGVACERAASALRVNHMVRIERSDPDHEPWLVAYHYKVCEAIKAHMPEERRTTLHRRIAHALQDWPEAPHALQAEQWLAAGEPLEAVRYRYLAAQESAKQSAKHQALDQAAKLYRATLELIPEPHVERELALICCRAHIGLVETVLHDEGNREHAFALLEHARETAEELELLPELAQIHHLRGSLQFPDGDLDQCLADHERARVYARQTSSPRLEVLSLAGEGDAFYARGRMRSAHARFEDCLTLCRDHGLEDLAVNYRLMRALTRYFQGDLPGALRDGSDAADGAARIRYQRTELIARCLPMSWALFDMSRSHRAAPSLRRALELCHKLGARRYEPVVLAHQARVSLAKGRHKRAETYATQAVELCHEQGNQVFGAIALVILAQVTANSTTCEDALVQAEEILDKNAWSHNHLIFYRDAMEVALQIEDYDRVERYAQALELYTCDEPLAWSQFFVGRARALSRHSRGEQVDGDLASLLVQARKFGLHAAAIALNEALLHSR